MIHILYCPYIGVGEAYGNKVRVIPVFYVVLKPVTTRYGLIVLLIFFTS